MNRNIFFILAFSVLLSFPLLAQQNQYFPDKPYAWVNDYADLFNSAEEDYLNRKLGAFEDSTSTQIFVVSLNEHGNMPIAQMGAEMGEQWKVGQKDTHNGMILLIYPNDREITIQTGYGLEEFIPDAIARRIIENEIKPNFRNNNYVLGVDKATDVIFGLLSGEFTAEQYSSEGGDDPVSTIFGILFIILMFFLFFGQSRRRRQHSIGKNIPFWIALSMLSGSRNSHSGSFGNFNSGSGGFGGFSGGGGGSFGGGGASGSW
ncbi:MAG: TPM domain-containing protein [Bacteroidales bacterium]|nr:TPM domain-containing protein [Bacteroidales bacterium]MCF8391027.1 TPM domain-containing protein [Bacteroidales bacterium]